MTSSNGNIFRVTVHLWGESTSHRWIPPVKRSFDVFFDPRLIKLLSKQSRHGYFDTPSRSSWCHCDGNVRCQSRSDLSVWTYGTQPSTDIHTSGKNIVTFFTWVFSWKRPGLKKITRGYYIHPQRVDIFFYGAVGCAVTLPLTKIIAIYILTPRRKHVEFIFRYWMGPLVDGKYVELTRFNFGHGMRQTVQLSCCLHLSITMTS